MVYPPHEPKANASITRPVYIHVSDTKKVHTMKLTQTSLPLPLQKKVLPKQRIIQSAQGDLIDTVCTAQQNIKTQTCFLVHKSRLTSQSCHQAWGMLELNGTSQSHWNKFGGCKSNIQQSSIIQKAQNAEQSEGTVWKQIFLEIKVGWGEKS